ncbi:heme ABC exporter ATP-binding protein CcmA [Martelella sp. HB161492]|uniref:heme ABC exporter ATP-binding protein CcmA n=1 Tax=Martelella sp. HB161492 TaxID=2720726 RepID=UPI0015908055
MSQKLQLCGLSARRGGVSVINDLSATVEEGHALLIRGANGAGKSTLLRVMAGLLPAITGTCFLHDSQTGESLPLSLVSHYLGHLDGMNRTLTVRDNLSFWRDFLKSEDRDIRGVEPGMAIEAAAEAVGLGMVLDLPFGYLSQGQKRRIAFARLLVVRRPVWLLDEPTTALDSAARGMLTGLMAVHLGCGGMIVAATHEPLALAPAAMLELVRPAADEDDPFLAGLEI